MPWSFLQKKGAGEGQDFHATWDVDYPDYVNHLVADDLTEP
jgi:hypothetical protein